MNKRRYLPQIIIIALALAVSLMDASGLFAAMNGCGGAAEPVPPIFTSATAISSTAIEVHWNDSNSGETGYVVERSKESHAYFTPVNYPGMDASFYRDSGLEPNTTYYYRVGILGSGDSLFGYSPETSVMTLADEQDPGTPEAPTVLQAHNVSGTSADLTWTDNSTSENGFVLERRGPSDSWWVKVYTTQANVVSYHDPSLKADTSYSYRIKAFNGEGSSVYSDTTEIKTPKVLPAAPGELQARAVSASRIDLQWKDNAVNEDAYIIERKGPGEEDYAVLATLSGDSASYQDKGLNPDSTYYYRVRAHNDSGESPYSGAASAVTYSSASQPATEYTELRYYLNSPVYYVNDLPLMMDTSPEITDGRIFVPLRYMAEALGANVIWADSEDLATTYFQHRVIEIWPGISYAKVDGVETMIEPGNSAIMPYYLPPGRTMIPLRFFAEAMGCTVEWLPEQNLARICYQPAG